VSNIAVLLATSRVNGNTGSLALEFANQTGANIFNLNDYQISPFDYEHCNRNDDFLSLISELVRFEHIVFASPVYWYSVCAQMKVFIDRLTDLLTIEKKLGRSLREKEVSLIVTGNDDEVPQCFEEPICRSFNYLGLEYSGCFYWSCKSAVKVGGSETELKRVSQELNRYLNNNFSTDSRIFSGS